MQILRNERNVGIDFNFQYIPIITISINAGVFLRNISIFQRLVQHKSLTLEYYLL